MFSDVLISASRLFQAGHAIFLPSFMVRNGAVGDACFVVQHSDSDAGYAQERLTLTLRVQGNSKFLGPIYCNLNGLWALKPYYLGPWTLIGLAVMPRHPRRWSKSAP